ncbi:MAG: DNA repair protein RadC [Betaproteobacteria bacterium]|jgi:DNA repair protein RadC|nr:DNA repair protein RadC [Betaproteobacteria bacterium]
MAAAAELVRRAMGESLREGPPLASPDAVRDYLRLSIGVRPFEVFTALFLDARHHLILAEDLFRGSVAQTSVYPREVARRCLQINASAVVLAHNHPSGAVQPSQADRELTRALVAALALVDVRVLDHLVVTRVDVYSFAEHGLL